MNYITPEVKTLKPIGDKRIDRTFPRADVWLYLETVVAAAAVAVVVVAISQIDVTP